jgi:molybdopterin-containing oxidoreductase family membrane subunit
MKEQQKELTSRLSRDDSAKMKHEETALRPLNKTSGRFYLLAGVLLTIIGWFVYAYIVQVRGGLVVTGMRDMGMPLAGAPWGIYIGNFIWFVGIAHGGITVSAVIRVLKLERYRNIGRMAELLTVVTIMMAGLSIIIDLGRPDRVLNMVLYYGSRLWQSPLVWDFTVIGLYLTLTITYLYITMREDLATLRDRFPGRWKWLYKPLLARYSPDEKPKVNQIAWWLAVTIVPMMVALSGGVIPWLFGLQGSQAGWFGAVQGPYFLTAALTSAVAGVIIVAAILRKVYRWRDQIKDEIFRHGGAVLAIFITFYIWFILHEQLTIRFAGPIAEFRISEALLTGRFAPLFWTMLVVGLLIPMGYLFVQAVRPKVFHMGAVLLSAVLVILALWVKRFLIVVPSLLYPRLPYVVGSYTPTWVEWSVVVGTIALATFLYLIFIKLFPIMELRRSSDA